LLPSLNYEYIIQTWGVRKRNPKVILQKPPNETLFPPARFALVSMQDSYPPPTQLKLNRRDRMIMVHARPDRTRPGPLARLYIEKPGNPGKPGPDIPPIEIDTEKRK
jgi:hypothetical protein